MSAVTNCSNGLEITDKSELSGTKVIMYNENFLIFVLN